MNNDAYRSFLDADQQQPTKTTFRLSFAGDIAIPLGVALVPTAVFTLMGLLMQDLGKPQAQIPACLAITVGGLQVVGMVAMAVVVLLRLEAIMKRLTLMSQGPPARWRVLSMLASIGCLTLFDLMFNLGGLFQGAIFLWYFAFPMFVLYLVMIQVTFTGLQQPTTSPADAE